MSIPAIFSTDWFTRNADNYTLADNTKSIGWVDLVNGKYSSYLYSQSIVNGLLSSPVELRKELERILGIVNLSNVDIHVDTTGDNSYTDGRSIVVSNHYSNVMTNEFDKMDMIIGLTLHEASHCMFTDFGYMRTHMNRINSVVKEIANIIEDEMIENKLGIMYPSFANFLAKTKYCYFGTVGNDLMSFAPKNDLDNIFRLFLYIVRYPKHVPSYSLSYLTKYNDTFNKIHDIMEKYECFDITSKKSTTTRSLDAAFEIYDLFKSEIEKENEVKGNGNDCGTGDDSSDEDATDWNSDDIDDYSDNVETEDKIKSFSEQEKEIINDENSLMNRKKHMQAHLSTTVDNKEFTDAAFIKLMKKVIKNELIVEMKPHTFGNKGCILGNMKVARNNVNRYSKLLNEVKPFINEAKSLILENQNKEVVTNIHFRRNGTIDTNRLVDAIQNINTVYKQQQINKAQTLAKYALVLILDESGSMYRVHDYVTSLAIVIAEAIKEYPNIELYVYGHGDKINCYVDKFHKDVRNIGSSELQGDQNDYEANKQILEAVKKQTQLPIVTISFTDSCYCQYNKMKELFDEYRKKNVSFNLVAVADQYWATGEWARINNDIYGVGNWVVNDNRSKKGTSDMIRTLAKLIRKNYEKRK